MAMHFHYARYRLALLISLELHARLSVSSTHVLWSVVSCSAQTGAGK